MTTIKGVDFLYRGRGASGPMKVCVDLRWRDGRLTWLATINRDPEFLELAGNTWRGSDESDRNAVIRSVSLALDAAFSTK